MCHDIHAQVRFRHALATHLKLLSAPRLKNNNSYASSQVKTLYTVEPRYIANGP